MKLKEGAHLATDRSRAGRIAKLIADDSYGDGLDLASRCMTSDAPGPAQSTCSAARMPQDEGDPWRNLPEVKAVQQLLTPCAEREAGQNSALLDSVKSATCVRSLGGNDRAVRLFLTFISAMNRARDATQLWKAGMRLYRDRPETFDPQHVAGLELDVLREVLKVARVSRRHGPDSRAWLQISKSLSAGPQSPVRQVIDAGQGDAQEVLRDLEKSRDNSGRNRFPMLRGPKVGPMWIRMMVNPGRALISRIETVTVAVDVQVRLVTENLGVAATHDLPLREAKPVIHEVWMNAVSEVDIAGPTGIAGTCAALDPVLWFFGKHGCGHCWKADKKVRFGRACDFCIRFK